VRFKFCSHDQVPRWTNAKMEIDTKSALNPIVQVRTSFSKTGLGKKRKSAKIIVSCNYQSFSEI
jgi:hypothetical protein